MANGLYDKGREAFLAGDIDWDADDIKVVLVDTAAYTVNLATHQFLSDIGAGARIATSANIAGKTVAAGVADADDLTISGVTGATIEAIVFYKDTGVAGTSRLICYMDTVSSGLPITPNGGAVNLVWNASGIFKL